MPFSNAVTDYDSNGEYHIDLWTGSNIRAGDNQINCEDSLPGGQLTIVNDPPDSLEVDSRFAPCTHQPQR